MPICLEERWERKTERNGNHRSRFVDGCKIKLTRKIAKSIFDKMEKFAGYGFNKSHSVAYALLSYQTAYLKAYYPREFFLQHYPQIWISHK